MRILIVSATEIELGKLRTQIQSNNVDILITGIGSSATIFKLTDTISKKKYNLIINIGIAGSFSKEFKLGDTVIVNQEQFGDLGFEDKNLFIPINKSEISKHQVLSFQNPNHFSFLNHLDLVNSITVNLSSGNTNTINNRISTFNPDIENMEGAGVFMVCLEKNIPFVEIRSISNYIEKRNTDNWNIPLAIKNLNTLIVSFINHLL